MNQLSQENRENQMQKRHKNISRGLLAVGAVAILFIAFGGKANSHEKRKEPIKLSSTISERDVAFENLRLFREQEQERLRRASFDKELTNAPQKMAYNYDQAPVFVPNTLAPQQDTQVSATINVVDVDAGMQTRMSASSTLFNNQQAHPVSHSSTNKEGNVASATIIGGGSGANFLNSEPGFEKKKAGWITHPDYTVPAGEMISATLETAVNSQLPGMVRAVTTRSIYALEGNKTLIPAGSLLIGQYSSDVKMGQKRALISWNRLQLPNGVLVAINSPSSDSIGRAGQGANHVDTHFIERFGQSALLSVLGFYAATSGVDGVDQFNSKSQFKTMLSESFQNASEQALSQTMNIEPTMIIHQGEKINVFVAHDLSFYDALHGRV